MTILTVAQAAEQYNMHQRTVYHNINIGRIKIIDVSKLGLPSGVTYISSDVMEEFVKNRIGRGRPRKCSKK